MKGEQIGAEDEETVKGSGKELSSAKSVV